MAVTEVSTPPTGGDVRRPKRLPRPAALRRAESSLQRACPAHVVTLAAVQGGAGVSATTLLLATAVAQASDAPTLALEVTGPTSGGLAAQAGVASQASPEVTARLIYDGTPVARPFAKTAGGVHVIAAGAGMYGGRRDVPPPLAGVLARAVAAGASDGELARLSREGVQDTAAIDLASARRGPDADALVRFLAGARSPHSLIAVDLGVADDDALMRYASIADLHVWVVAVRDLANGYLAEKLAAQRAVARQEVVLAWMPAGYKARSKDLLQLGVARGCEVVRLPTYGAEEDWPTRATRCAGSLEMLCNLLP